MKRRTIEGATCATCRQPTGLVIINGKSVTTEPTACVTDGVILLEMHRCPGPTPATSSPSSSTTRPSGTRARDRPRPTGR